ncbi:MAG: outer membrane beta-barrel protein [Candidatus Tectomicrobia bacterium]|nr:outer membrane beta-barrel protein [Candidatus Tectomicrobia bacterium]
MKRGLLVMGLLVATLGWGSTAQADYYDGLRAADAGRHSEALREWQDAANVGDAEAMLALGRLYMQGLGVPQNYVQAHMWFNLAASRGEAEAVIERDALTAHMEPDLVAKAQEQAVAWQQQHSEVTHRTEKSYFDCIDARAGIVGLIKCLPVALGPDQPDYFRFAGGITEGIYTFSENTTTDADAGVSLIGALGFIANNNKKLRAEIEIGYSSNPLNKRAATNSDGTIMEKDTVGTLRQISAMLGVTYEFIPDCPITPYLKAGIGPTFLTISDVKVENRLLFEQQTKTFFAYQFGGGLKYSINEMLAIDVGYRHIDTLTDVTVQTGSNRATVGIGNHTGLIGLTYLWR